MHDNITFKLIDFNRKPNHSWGLQIWKVVGKGIRIIVSNLTSTLLSFQSRENKSSFYAEWMRQFILFRPKAYQKGICMRWQLLVLPLAGKAMTRLHIYHWDPRRGDRGARPHPTWPAAKQIKVGWKCVDCHKKKIITLTWPSLYGSNKTFPEDQSLYHSGKNDK